MTLETDKQVCWWAQHQLTHPFSQVLCSRATRFIVVFYPRNKMMMVEKLFPFNEMLNNGSSLRPLRVAQCFPWNGHTKHNVQEPRQFFFFWFRFPQEFLKKLMLCDPFCFLPISSRWWFHFFYFHQYFGEDSHFEKNIFSTGLKIPSNNPYIRTVAKKPLPGFIASLSWKKYLPRSSGWSSW